MSVEENKAIVRVIFDGFDARDLDRVAAICADDFVLEDLPAGVVLNGPEGMRNGCKFGSMPRPTPTPPWNGFSARVIGWRPSIMEQRRTPARCGHPPGRFPQRVGRSMSG